MENKVTIVSFSSREIGNCGQISCLIQDMIPGSSIQKFSSFRIEPCGNCEYQCFQNRENCPYFDDMEHKLLDTICESTLAYFVVPCYSGYPCSNFFVFNERSQCFFQGRPDVLEHYLNIPKKFIVISNTDTENFHNAFIQHTNKTIDMLILSANHYGRSSIGGDILSAAQACADLKAFLR